jgi:hypothetical protein
MAPDTAEVGGAILETLNGKAQIHATVFGVAAVMGDWYGVTRRLPTDDVYVGSCFKLESAAG